MANINGNENGNENQSDTAVSINAILCTNANESQWKRLNNENTIEIAMTPIQWPVQ